MNNLKKFNTEADYSAATLNYPAVSWVTSTDVVHFDKTVPTPSFSGLTVYYNITDISQPTVLFNGGGGSGSGSGSGGVLPSAMIIDGTEVEVANTYQFSTTSEHIINYSFADNTIPERFLNSLTHVTNVVIGDTITSIGNYAFQYCSGLTSIIIPDNITSIGDFAFYNCSGLTSITIGNQITEIGELAFGDCSGLTSITVEAVDPPELWSESFNNTNDCPIYVPAASVDTYKAATSKSWSEYASRIQAIQ